jgi:hypothetical protein
MSCKNQPVEHGAIVWRFWPFALRNILSWGHSFMSKTPHLTKLRNKPLSLIPAERGARQRAVSTPKEPAAAKPLRHWFNRNIGFRLGGVILGAGGCLLGASMPYQHPVGVAVSLLWWGIYLGCLGASLGALMGLWAERRRRSRARRST